MAITLDALTLPSTLYWVNELSRTPRREVREYSLGQRLVRQPSEVLSGVPVVISGGAHAWMSRADALAIHAMIQSDEAMSLDIHGTALLVRWDFLSSPFSATPVMPHGDPTGADIRYENLAFNFIEVSE
jgi:hypothetical protein